MERPPDLRPVPPLGSRNDDFEFDLTLRGAPDQGSAPGGAAGRDDGLLYEPPESRCNPGETYAAPDLAVPPAQRRWDRSRRSWLLLLLLPMGAALGYWLKPLPPLLGVTVPALSFDAVRLGAVETRSIEVENRGGRQLAIGSARVERSGQAEGSPEFTITQDACAAQVLKTSDRCTVTVAFSPQERGMRRATVWVGGDAPNGPIAVSLVGQGIAPQVALEPASLTFAGLPIGASGGVQGLRVRNDGTSPLAVTAVELEGLEVADFRLADDRCSGQTLKRGDHCRVQIAFSPRAEGERRASLWVRSDAPDGALSVAVVGRGLAQEPLLSVDVTSLDLGAVAVGAATDASVVALINDGSGPLSVSAVTLGETVGDFGVFTIEAETCMAEPIEPGDRCAVSVVYAAARAGAIGTSVVIEHSADQVPMTIPVRALGLAPGLRMVPLRLAFDEVPLAQLSAKQQVTFENTGMAPLQLSTLRLDGADAASFMLDAGTCAKATLAPGDRCLASLRMRPRREGNQRAELVVRHNAAGGEERIPVTGEGLAPRLELDTARLDYGGLTIGSRRDLSVTLTNDGRAPLRLAQVSLGGADRAAFGLVANRCANATLAPGNRCTVAIRFEPATEGALRGELVVKARDIDTRRTVPLTGIGLPRPVPKVRVEPGGFDFGPYDVGRRSEIATVTVQNVGTGPLTVGDFRVAGQDAVSFEVVIGSCERGGVVAAGGSCTVGVRYVPARVGPTDAQLVIRHNAGSGRDEATLRGEGLNPMPPPGPGP